MPSKAEPLAATDQDNAVGVSISKATLFGWFVKALAVAVPFLIGWAIKLEINNARLAFEVDSLKEKVTDVQAVAAGGGPDDGDTRASGREDHQPQQPAGRHSEGPP